MSTATLPTATIDFAQINGVSRKLRKLGAKFTTSVSGGRAFLKFQKLPDKAKVILFPSMPICVTLPDPWNEPTPTSTLPTATVVEPKPMVLRQPLALPAALETHEDAQMATCEQLRQLSKKRLKSLASALTIEGRSKLDEAGLVQALLGRVLANQLK